MQKKKRSKGKKKAAKEHQEALYFLDTISNSHGCFEIKKMCQGRHLVNHFTY